VCSEYLSFHGGEFRDYFRCARHEKRSSQKSSAQCSVGQKLQSERLRYSDSGNLKSCQIFLRQLRNALLRNALPIAAVIDGGGETVKLGNGKDERDNAVTALHFPL
jgi:hypothetical protein